MRWLWADAAARFHTLDKDDQQLVMWFFLNLIMGLRNGAADNMGWAACSLGMALPMVETLNICINRSGD